MPNSTITPPPATAPFAAKLAYYRSQHTTAGVRATHLVGIPTVVLSLPLLVARPKAGVKAFAAGWGLQVLGHAVFEKNSPALRNGPITYQLCGLAFWCEEVVDLIARGNQRRLGVRGSTVERRAA